MIKTILFDFGGVFLELDKTATHRHLKDYFPEGLPLDIQKLHHQYEKGKVDSEEFISAHLKASPNLTKDVFIKAWNAMLGDLPDHRLAFLKKLQSAGHYQLLLLSNTNELHINWVKSNVSNFDEFRACFERFYLSYEIGYRKPDQDIFEYVLNENQLNPEETLFIDDTEEHTLTADKLGLKNWHLNEKHEDVTDLLSIKKSIL